MKNIILLDSKIIYTKEGFKFKYKRSSVNYKDLTLIFKKNNIKLYYTEINQFNNKNKTFKQGFNFDGKKWKKEFNISPTIIWYKSNIINNKLKKIAKEFNIINHPDFVDLANDKFETAKKFSNISIKTYYLKNILTKKELLNDFESEKVIIKPNNGSGGKDVCLVDKKNFFNKIKNYDINNYIVQEFVESSCGIPNLVEGIHDFRFVVIGGNISHAYIRIPKKMAINVIYHKVAKVG